MDSHAGVQESPLPAAHFPPVQALSHLAGRPPLYLLYLMRRWPRCLPRLDALEQAQVLSLSHNQKLLVRP